MEYVNPRVQSVQEVMIPMAMPSYIIDLPLMKQRIKTFASSNRMFSALPVTAIVGQNVFWDAFQRFIFPWILDVSKVWCAIKICQGFYKEKRGMGGSDGDGGMSSLLTYGRWLILLYLVPFGVDLFDGIAKTMYNNLHSSGTF
jgi:hypothetical protein